MIFTRFATLLTEILRYSESHQTTIIIDEFQRLAEIGDGIISDIQQVWDTYQPRSQVHLIAIEKLDKRATVAEVKRNIRKYNPAALAEKYQHIKLHFQGYTVELIGLSLENM